MANPIAPVSCLVTDRGYLVTVDNWYGMGSGKVVASYAPDGALIAGYELGDLFSTEEIRAFLHTASSISWRGKTLQVREGQQSVQITAADTGKELFYEPETGQWQFCEHREGLGYLCRTTNVDRVWAPFREPELRPSTDRISFETHDGHPLHGKLTLPAGAPARAVVVYVQTAEGMTVDMRRPDGRGGTFDYFDLYRKELPALGVGFFGYEGRGIRMGEAAPRYEAIEREVYDTSTLENKVRDVLAAVAAVRVQPGLGETRIFLLGASEGTLLAAQAAARAPDEIQGLVLYGVMAQNMRETFTYILSQGAFLTYLGYFDADKDGRITKEEFESDPRRFRANALGGTPFETFDKDGDGLILEADLTALAQPLIDAVQQDNFELLDLWARHSAGVSTPKDWFKDHFAQEPLWTFLAPLRIPVGLFHGALDTNTPIAGVRALEEQARAVEGSSQLEFFYFDELDHSLGIGAYFRTGTLPAGHRAIFEYVRGLANGS